MAHTYTKKLFVIYLKVNLPTLPQRELSAPRKQRKHFDKFDVWSQTPKENSSHSISLGAELFFPLLEAVWNNSSQSCLGVSVTWEALTTHMAVPDLHKI